MHSLALMGTALPTLNAEALLALTFPNLISSLGQVAEDQVDVFMRMPPLAGNSECMCQRGLHPLSEPRTARPMNSSLGQ